MDFGNYLREQYLKRGNNPIPIPWGYREYIKFDDLTFISVHGKSNYVLDAMYDSVIGIRDNVYEDWIYISDNFINKDIVVLLCLLFKSEITYDYNFVDYEPNINFLKDSIGYLDQNRLVIGILGNIIMDLLQIFVYSNALQDYIGTENGGDFKNAMRLNLPMLFNGEITSTYIPWGFSDSITIDDVAYISCLQYNVFKSLLFSDEYYNPEFLEKSENRDVLVMLYCLVDKNNEVVPDLSREFLDKAFEIFENIGLKYCNIAYILYSTYVDDAMDGVEDVYINRYIYGKKPSKSARKFQLDL
jgi:hypothetical protein